MSFGPNVKKLICEEMARLLVPSGGGIAAAVAGLSSGPRVLAAAKRATDFARHALESVRQAPDFDPVKYPDDEAIAGEILQRLTYRREELRAAARHATSPQPGRPGIIGRREDVAATPASRDPASA